MLKRNTGRIFLVLSLTLVLMLCGCRSQDYKTAVSMIEDENYEEALALLESVGDYRDASDLAVSCRYELAEAAYADEDYEKALELYRSVGAYEGASQKAAVCEREFGMREHADYLFLEQIEASVLDRLHTTTNTQNNDLAALVNKELVYLEAFRNAEFYNEDLKEAAQLYLSGLDEQKEALSEEYQFDFAYRWQEGAVRRKEALTVLYENYGFLKDDQSFVTSYIMQLEEDRKLLTAYEEIDADIGSQLGTDETFWMEQAKFSNTYDTVTFSLTNNTEYRYTFVIEMNFYDKNGVLYYSPFEYVEDIKPHSTFEVEVWGSNVDRMESFEYETWYTDIVTG